MTSANKYIVWFGFLIVGGIGGAFAGLTPHDPDGSTAGALAGAIVGLVGGVYWWERTVCRYHSPLIMAGCVGAFACLAAVVTSGCVSAALVAAEIRLVVGLPLSFGVGCVTGAVGLLFVPAELKKGH